MKFSSQYGLVFDIHVPHKDGKGIYPFSVIGKTFEDALELAKKVAEQNGVLDKLDWSKAAPPELVSFCSNCGRFHKKAKNVGSRENERTSSYLGMVETS